jgi:hypothetical protein
VILDGVGLLSFGGGKLIGKGLKGTMTATRAEAAAADGAEAEEAARRVGAAAREAAVRDSFNRSLSIGDRQQARMLVRKLDQDALSAEQKATHDLLDAPLAKAKFRQVLAAGSREDPRMVNTTKQLLAEHPGNDAVRTAARNLRRQMWSGRANFVGTTTLDGAAKAADQAADRTSWSWAHSYRDFTERFTLSEGTLDEPATSAQG